MAVKVLRVFQEFTSAGYVPMPIAGNIDYGVTVANTFPATTPATFQTDDPDIEVNVTEVTDFYVWIRSHGTAWNYLYTRNVRVYPDSPSINNVVMGIIIARLTDAVPYTGATQDTDLGEFGLKAGWLGLDLTPTNTPTDVGTISWDDQDGTANLVLKGGNVNLQIGQEQVTRVVNKTGASLLEANYQAVRISGAQGNRLKVSLAQANNDANSADTIGLVTETIANNEEGFVTTSGLVKGINTTGSLQSETWVDGDVLYLSGTTAGMITNVKPQAPTHTVIIGYVVRAHATQGQIYVKVDNGYELDELHNVRITTPTDKDFLIYDGTNQYWKNRDLFGTTGYLPVYDTTSLLKDSIIYTDGTAIGIGTNVLQSGAVATFGDVAHFTENISLADSKGIVSGGVNMLSRNNLNNQIIIGADGGINDNVAFYAGDLERMRLLANGRLAINKTTASYQVDVQGDVNVSGAFRVNGTIIPNGTVTSVAMSVPTGLVISGSPITSSGTLAVTYAVNYGIPTLTKQSDWDDAYTWVTNFPDQLGNAGKFLTTNGSALSWASLVTGVSSVFGRTGAVVAQSGDYTTAQVTESGNLYYTDARARLALSGGTGITYNNTTGVIAYSGTVYTDSSIRALFSAGSGISYNSTTGVITSTITQYTDAMARASLSFVAGSGSYNSTTGVITIPTNTNQLTNGASFITLASLSASSPLSYNTGTGAFSISQASGTTNGFLSSSDWTTFNNKASTSQLANYLPLTGGTLTGNLNGTSASFSGAITLSGNSYFKSSATLGFIVNDSTDTYNNFISYNNGNVYVRGNLGINTTSPGGNLEIFGGSSGATAFSNGSNIIVQNSAAVGISLLSPDANASRIYFGTASNNRNAFIYSDYNAGSQTLIFGVGNGVTGATERMRITSAGNVGIGTSSPSYLLDVNGIGRFSGGYQTPVAIFERNADYGQVITLGRKGVSASAGIGYPADAVISFLTNGSERARIDSSGNLGLNVTPSAWSVLNVLQINNAAFGGLGNNAYMTGNAYYDGSSWRYIASSTATLYAQQVGTHVWYNAVSGTAGGAISYNQAMTLNASGNLGLGITPQPWTSAHKVIQFGAIGSIETDNDAVAVSNNRYFDGVNRYSANDFASIYVQVNGEHRWLTAPSGIAGNSITFTTPMMLDASGNLMVATTTASNSAGGRGNITIGGSSTSILNFQIGGSLAAYLYHDNNNLNILNSKASGELLLSTNSTERMRITSAGQLLVGLTSGYSNGVTIKGASDDYSLTLAQSNASNAGWGQWADTGGNYKLSRYGGGAYSSPALTITLAGAATFSSSVTAGTLNAISTLSGASLNISGTQSTFRIASNYTGGGDLLSGTLMYIDDVVNNNLTIIPSSAGTNGSKIVAAAYNGSAWRSMWEFANTNSGNPNLILVKSGGNVGIGSTSPNVGGWGRALTLQGVSNAAYEVTEGTVRAALFSAAASIAGLSVETNHPLGLYTNGTERMRITSGGQIYMGNSAGDGYRLQIFGTNQAGSTFGQTYIGVAAYSQWVNSSGAFVMGLDGASGTTERMRITSGGDVNIGSSPSTGYKFNVRNASGNYISFWSPTIAGNAVNGILSHNGGGFNSQVAMGYNASLHVFNGEVTGGGLVQVAGDVNISGAFKINGTAIGTGGGGVSGSGSTNYVAKWSAGTSLTNSNITDNGTTITLYHNTGSGNVSFTYNNTTWGTGVNMWNSNVYPYGVNAGGIYFSVSGTQRMYLKSNGTLLYTANGNLDIIGNTTSGGSSIVRLDSTTGIGYNAETVHVFYTSLSEVARFNGAGEFLIGTTTDNGAYKLQVNSQIWATNATIATSDVRLKDNIQDISNALSVIMGLKPRTFTYKQDKGFNFGKFTNTGFIAQEIKESMTGLNYLDSIVLECGNYYGVAYEKFIPILTKGIQEQQEIIERLEEKIRVLESNVN